MIAEIMALGRYAWTKNRTITLILVLTAIVSEILLMAAIMLSANEIWRRGIATVAVISVGLCLLYTIVLFEFGKTTSLSATDGSFDRWLLRLPLPSWKLALIPAGLITIWITVFWTMFAITIRSVDGPRLSFVTEPLAMSAWSICTLAITWTPQRLPWQRSVTFLLSLPVLFTLAAANVGSLEAPLWFRVASGSVALLCYAAASLIALRSIRLARISAYQQSPSDGSANVIEQMTEAISKWFESWKITSGQFSSPTAALRWYDLTKSQSNRWRFIGLYVVIIALAVISFRLTAASTAAAVLGLFLASVGSITVAGALFEQAVWANQSSLPSYLIASPLSSRSIAWTRMALAVNVATKFFAFVSLIFLANFLIDSNRELPTRLSQRIASFAVAGSPIRTILACHVGVLFLSLSVALNLIWVQFDGRQHHGLGIFFLGMLIVSAPGSVALSWFMKQTDWETVSVTCLYWMQRIPFLINVATALKLLMSAVAIFSALRQQFVTVKLTIQIIAVWALVVSAVATSFWLLWPGDDLPYHTVLIGATLVVPLAAIFASPLAVAANRHPDGKTVFIF